MSPEIPVESVTLSVVVLGGGAFGLVMLGLDEVMGVVPS